ncbi:DNA-binding protein [hydrothermal vent metagenome]|uniref:DNA-binding protein n=1 Tax=hydrothermal vent metagenome TaxID=652676 RepID=A0A1W1CM98_9ZZZZ
MSDKLRKSIYDKTHINLRKFWIDSRKKLNLSQRELANKLKINHSLVAKIETGNRQLNCIEMVNYCYALEVNPYLVIDLIDNYLKQENISISKI